MRVPQDEDLLFPLFRQLNSSIEERCRAASIECTQPDLHVQRGSQIGCQIIALVEFVRGERAIASPEIEISIAALQRLLYTSPMGTYCLPADFHKTPLGALINEARLRFIWIGDAVNPTQAARGMGVSRQTIYDWINQGKLEPVWVNDRPLLLPAQLLALKNRFAREIGER